MHKPREIIAPSRLCLRSPIPADLQPLHENVLSDAVVMALALTGRGQLDYRFNVLGLKRLLALVSPANQASMTVLRKIGMKFDRSVKNADRGDRDIFIAQMGYPTDSAMPAEIKATRAAY